MKLEPGLRLESIDPGVDSGFTFYTMGNPLSSMLSWQGKYTHDQFVGQLNEVLPDIIICESFDHRAKDNVNYTPAEYIGLVKWYVERRQIPIVFQTPSFGKAYPILRLKKLGMYVPGDANEDRMMALRHMLQFLTANNAFDFGLLK